MVRFTMVAAVLSQCGPRTSDGSSALACMEKIMAKTTDNTEVCELSVEELDSVSGGVELVHERRHVANKTECLDLRHSRTGSMDAMFPLSGAICGFGW